MTSRLPITKTPKCYVGGAFIRSESGKVQPLLDQTGAFVANIPQCSRKDLRNAVEAAAKAGPGWAKRTAFNRGQILYRLAEMMEARAQELVSALLLTRPQNAKTTAAAALEVRASIDRTVHYAGWTDKYEALLGSVNPVASPHFNFTTVEPVGIVGILAPEQAPLLGLLSLVLPAITSGNAVVALASPTEPYPALLLGEMLATSDLPGGVVNLLTGTRKDLLPTFATHEHLRAISAMVGPDERRELRAGAAASIKRTHLRKEEQDIDWQDARQQGLEEIRALIELKTIWHPVGV
jgi:acyl-CoA reductase-like NAD-dependent aldehyde dehydrogenase